MNFSIRRLFNVFYSLLHYIPIIYLFICVLTGIARINSLNYLEDIIRAREKFNFLIPNGEVLAIRRNFFQPELRVLINDTTGDEVKQQIKYITLRMPVPERDPSYISRLVSVWYSRLRPTVVNLPSLPLGNWTEASVRIHEETQTYRVHHLSDQELPGIKNAWHPLKIEYFDLNKVRKLKTDSAVQYVQDADFLQVVTHPVFGDDLVLMKINSFPDHWEDGFIETEINVYQKIQDLDIAPQFLGHVTEHGRVIGFLSEFLADAVPASEVWTHETRELYREVLHELHSRNISHRDAHWNNCLIRKDGTAALIDFELSIILPANITSENDPDTWEQFRDLCDADLRQVITDPDIGNKFLKGLIATMVRPLAVIRRLWDMYQERDRVLHLKR